VYVYVCMRVCWYACASLLCFMDAWCCACMCIIGCSCTYACMRVQVCVHTKARVSAHVQHAVQNNVGLTSVHLHAYMHVCIYHVHMCMHMNMQVCMLHNTRWYLYTFMRTHVCFLSCTYMHAYVHTYVHASANTAPQNQLYWKQVCMRACRLETMSCLQTYA